MANIDLNREIEQYVASFKPVPDSRRYWLIRTMTGQFYDSYVEHGYVAIGYNEITYSTIYEIYKKVHQDKEALLNELRPICEKFFPEDSRPGLIASQLIKFIFEVKKGDVIVIPSSGSERIAIGYVTETPVIEATAAEVEKTECQFIKRKKIKWHEKLHRGQLDPYLYRVLQAHQAINEITPYGDIIERILGNFYIKDGIGNVVLNVERNANINAVDLFQLGYYLLQYSQHFFDKSNLPFNVNDIDVKINLNSKGKIQLKSVNAKTIWLISVLVLFVNGGGLRLKTDYGIDFDLSTDGLIKTIMDYQNSKQDREMTNKIAESLDSLQIRTPDDAVKVFQQFNTNKK